MNMDALDFDGDMWDPEYCDSELRAVEASGEGEYITSAEIYGDLLK